jgi:hypothetical protein
MRWFGYEVEDKLFEDGEIEEVFRSVLRALEELFYPYEERIEKLPPDEEIVKRIAETEYGDRIEGVSSSSIYGGNINIIPARENSRGQCSKIVVVFCFSRGKLDTRFWELQNLMSLYCRGITKKALILTNQWNNKIWEDYFDKVFRFLLHTDGIKIFKAQLEGRRFIKTCLV